MTKQPQTLIEAIIYFSDETKAHDYVVSKRWKNGAECSVCGSTNLTFIETRKKWKCRDNKCTAYNKQFTVKKGTIFEDSPIKLSKWLPAIWMIANNKNGKSSCELGKDLGVTQKTAWFMLHRIRTSMGKGFVKLKGTVEVDETYMGGKASNMHASKKAEKVQGRGVAGKTIVMGMVERSEEVSQVQAKVIPDTTKFTLQSEVIESVLENSNLYTDGHLSYEGLDALFEHLSVDHHLHEYVNGDVHTNTMENFWTLLKRSIKGTYVSVEDEHLDRYIDEQSFRYNTRKDSDYERFEKAVSGVEGKKITYAELTAHEQLRGA